MTDEQMDARLRRAGEAWRATSAPTVEIQSVEPHTLTEPVATRPGRHRTALLASAAAVAAALVAGTSILVANLGGKSSTRPSAENQGVPLVGTVWRFLGFGDQTMPNSLASFYIAPDGQFVADDTCDLVGGRMNVDQGHLYPTQLQLRYYSCTDSVGEVTFDLDVLTSGPAYTLDPSGVLTITGAGKTMHLVAAPQLPVPTLDRPTVTGATWKLTKVTDGNGTDMLVNGDATFRVANGQLQASDTCNTLTGDAAITGSDLDVKNLSTTEIGCAKDVTSTASVIDDVFAGQASIGVEGATRLVISRQGAGTLSYAWVPDDATATDPASLTNRTWYLSSLAGDPVAKGVTLQINDDGTVSGYDGCQKLDAKATAGAGTLQLARPLPSGGSGAGCDNPDLATSVDSLLDGNPALWHTADGKLVINGYGAQAFAMVFQSTPPNQPASLTGTPWTLVKITDADGNDVPVAGTASLSITGDGRLTGRDGCNYVSSDVQLGDNTIDFGALSTTAMACSPQAVMTTAQHVDAVLHGPVGWRVDGDQLTLTHDGVGTLVYRSGTSDVSPPFAGTAWTLTTIENGSGMNGTASSVVTDVTVRFLDTGHVTVSHRCYVDKGDVQIGSGTLTISNKTLENAIPCASTQAQQEEQRENQVVDDVLSGQSQWRMNDKQLQISKDGVGTLVFGPAAGPASLVATAWTLASMSTEGQNSGGGSASSNSGIVLTIGKGQYQLATGCHSYQGTADVSGPTITFGNQQDLGGDDCLNTMAQELVTMLDGTVAWTVSDGQLTLTKGNTTAIFTG